MNEVRAKVPKPMCCPGKRRFNAIASSPVEETENKSASGTESGLNTLASVRWLHNRIGSPFHMPPKTTLCPSGENLAMRI